VSRGVATVFLLGEQERGAIEVGAIQAIAKKSNYLINILLGEFKKNYGIHYKQ
jgi:hypothetical protein